ncbi:MAG: tetratricopeptide repeat protein, partial [Planctomycetes bacterium]|nr:tetratricopeptide repeat protein [Planctomycetota bacterium]
MELATLENLSASGTRSALIEMARGLVERARAEGRTEVALAATVLWIEFEDDSLETESRALRLREAHDLAAVVEASGPRIDLLLFEARSLMFDAEFEAAHLAMRRAQDLINESADNERRVESYKLAAWLSLAQGRLAGATALMDDAVRLADTLAIRSLAARTRYSRIVLRETLGIVGPDDEVSLRALCDHFEASGDIFDQALALTELSVLCARRGEYSSSVDCSERGIELLDRLGCTAAGVQRRVQLAGYLSILGRLRDATRWLRQALAMQTGRDHALLVAHTRIELGRVLAASGRLPSALTEVESALAVAESANDRQLVAIAQEEVGVIRVRLSQPDLALRSFMAAERSYRVFGDLAAADAVRDSG